MKMRTGDFSDLLYQVPTSVCSTPPCQVGTDPLGRPVYYGEIYDWKTNRPDGAGGIVRDGFGFDPVTGAPTATANQIPSARLSGPSTVFASKALPATNFGPAGALTTNWTGPSAPFGRDSNRETLKLDGYVAKNHLSGGFEILTGFNQVNA